MQQPDNEKEGSITVVLSVLIALKGFPFLGGVGLNDSDSKHFLYMIEFQ